MPLRAFTLLKPFPATVALIVINVAVFGACFFIAGTLEGQRWTLTLLRLGALYNPLALDKEWYRVVTHLFQHGSILHLGVNLYGLSYLGYTLEREIGTKKFVFLYLVCGLAAALNGLYWNLFTMGVGDSAALFGLFGFALVKNLYFSGRNVTPMLILLGHIAAFVGFNLLLPDAFYPDYSALFGGVITGMVIGFITFSATPRTAMPNVKFEYVMIVLLFIVYFLLPRNQVRYFRFFRHVVAAEDSTRLRFRENLTDDQYMRGYIRNVHHWEDVLDKLNGQTNVPVALSTDTFKLRKYISLRRQENLYRKLVVQQEAYVYLDSVDRLQSLMQPFLNLDYRLWSRIRLEPEPDSLAIDVDEVHYDSNGVETTSPDAYYYRVGHRDALGRWDGPVREYYSNGSLKMKGHYRENKRNGIFLFYSEAQTYTEAGRYIDDRRFGKWETYHPNGRLASEAFYNNNYFLNSMWDSLGNQLVVDGNGREIQHFPNGVVATEGEYRHGLKEGYWYGRYPNGEIHYEEQFSNGRLVSGKSRNLWGETFLYDATSLTPMPEGGFERFADYLKSETKKIDDEMGHVKLSFRVAVDGSINNIVIDQSSGSSFLDKKAQDIILNGPSWLPARNHGYEAVAARAFVQVEFY